MNTILYTIVQQIKNISILLNPIIPITSEKVLNTMNIEKNNISIENINNFNIINYNKELKDQKILFKKIENDN